MGLFPILAIGLGLVCIAGLGTYAVQEARVNPMVLAVRGVMIVLIIGILAFGWHMRGGV
jgi:hypothetical protein